MQSADDKESCQAEKSLVKNGSYKFDLKKHGSRVEPIGFVYNRYIDTERKIYSLTVEAISVRWDIREIYNTLGEIILLDI